MQMQTIAPSDSASLIAFADAKHFIAKTLAFCIAFLDGYLPLLHSAWASDLGNERNPNDNEVSSNQMVTGKTTC